MNYNLSRFIPFSFWVTVFYLWKCALLPLNAQNIDFPYTELPLKSTDFGQYRNGNYDLPFIADLSFQHHNDSWAQWVKNIKKRVNIRQRTSDVTGLVWNEFYRVRKMKFGESVLEEEQQSLLNNNSYDFTKGSSHTFNSIVDKYCGKNERDSQNRIVDAASTASWEYGYHKRYEFDPYGRVEIAKIYKSNNLFGLFKYEYVDNKKISFISSVSFYSKEAKLILKIQYSYDSQWNLIGLSYDESDYGKYYDHHSIRFEYDTKGNLSYYKYTLKKDSPYSTDFNVIYRCKYEYDSYDRISKMTYQIHDLEVIRTYVYDQKGNWTEVKESSDYGEARIERQLFYKE